MNVQRAVLMVLTAGFLVTASDAQVVPKNMRGTSTAERSGTHDANNIRTVFWNYGMVGDYPKDPLNVDVRYFHSVEVPKTSGVNYSDGTTPFILSKISQNDGTQAYIMETGYRERQAIRSNGQAMRFEPRPGYFEPDVSKNIANSPAMSNDKRTWPTTWPDKDTSWNGYWDGYFGKAKSANQESYFVVDDDYYDAWNYQPDVRDATRKGLGMRVEVRGFQWSNVQSGNVIFFHYDISNEGTVNYPENGQKENIIFGLYMDSGVGGEAISCDGIAESDDDNAYWDRSYAGLNLVYTWDVYGHGIGAGTTCAKTGYLGYAYLETPGKPYDGVDNDNDGITDELRDSTAGQLIVGQGAIAAYVRSHYNMTKFEAYYGKLEDRPAYVSGRWWTGDEDLDWVAEYDDVGSDGIGPKDEDYTGPDLDGSEGNGKPDQGEPDFGKTDPDESDQIGLTGFKMNRIAAGKGNPDPTTDGIVFFTDALRWPQRLYEKFTSVVEADRFDAAVAANYNIGFLFASGPFTLKSQTRERFSLALAYGEDLPELRKNVSVVQAIYNANYKFTVPPPTPTVKAFAGDHSVQLVWDDVAERGTNPIVGYNAFEGYKIYKSTDPDFADPKIMTTGTGSAFPNNGRAEAQFDLADGKLGYTDIGVDGVQFYLGDDRGLQHSWTDTAVTNGQQYYYAVCSYDWGPVLKRGSTSFTYYPSESPIVVSRSLRGGIVMASNVVGVRPNPKVVGYVGPSASGVTRLSGSGYGSVGVNVAYPTEVPKHHVFTVTFNTMPDSVHAVSYTLRDSTAQTNVFVSGNIFDGTPRGQVGAGVMPVVYTPDFVSVDSTAGFTATSRTNAKLKINYKGENLSLNYKRFGYPDNVTIRFSNTVIDTSMEIFPYYDALPLKFTVIAHTAAGDRKLKFVFQDKNNDSTLSHSEGGDHEVISILTGPDTMAALKRITWAISLTGDDTTTITPTLGDAFELKLRVPFTGSDSFSFTTEGETVSADKTKEQFDAGPYVVPNPYVGAASFEPNPYGVTGRGERRLEFRNLPASCTIRIYTVRGDLVQTLHHDGSVDGYVAWDLRSKDNLDVAPGLYIYHVDGGDAGTHVGKFAIVK